MAKYKLADLCEFITDGTHQTPEYCGEDGVIFLSSKDVTEGKINWEDVKYIPNCLHEKLCKRLSPCKDDILLAKNGTTGVAAIVDREEVFDVYVSLAVLRPLNTIYPKYLLYAINSPVAKRQFDAGLKGIGVPNLHLGVIRQTVINVADREKQEGICKILDKIVTIIDKRKLELNELDNLIKARFVEMFGNSNDDWEKVTVADICTDMRTGPFGSALHHDEFVDKGIFVLGIDNAVENKFSYNRMRYITEEKYEKLKRYTVYPGDVIITIMGTVGRSAVIPQDMPKAINTKHLACLTPNTDMVDSYFLANAFQIHPSIRGQLENQSKGAIMDGLNLTIIKGLKFELPPLKLQKKFVDFYKRVDKSKLQPPPQEGEIAC